MSIANRGKVLRQLDRLFREGTLVGLGDSQLLERYLTRRDEAAFEALLNLHGPMVLALCRRILHDPRDVEDAFQATFLVFVRKASAIRDRGLLSNWLYGVALRVATRARSNTLRRRGREMTVANLEAAVDAEAPDFLGIGPALDQELSRLPGKYRAPLVLCYLKGQTHDQAAVELRCPVGTVRSRLARGRDLLKRRLTRRGFAPTAAVLGTGSSLPAQFLTEAVPPSLIAATVEAAFASGTFTTIQAGAAATSMLALTQGVLTSMKLAQLKWIGLALLTTSLSAGGAIAFSHARAQSARAGGGAVPSAVSMVDPQEASSPQSKEKAPRATSVTGRTQEDAEKEIERKIDQFLQDIGFGDGSFDPTGDGPLANKVLYRKFAPMFGRSSSTSSSVGSTSRTSARTSPSSTGTSLTSTQTPAPINIANDPFSPTSALTRFDSDSRMTVDTTHRSVRELELEIKLALEAFDRIETLYQQGAIALQQREAARGRVLLTTAILEGLHDELDEQNERFGLEHKRKRAELAQAQAQTEVAASVVARNVRLNTRKAGMVGDEDVTKAKAELKGAEAQVAVKQVEMEELELRRVQSSRRAQRIKQVIALAERAKASGVAAPPAQSTVPAVR